nr:hypothetical protein [Tanacetum cinerariifolium]
QARRVADDPHEGVAAVAQFPAVVVGKLHRGQRLVLRVVFLDHVAQPEYVRRIGHQPGAPLGELEQLANGAVVAQGHGRLQRQHR